MFGFINLKLNIFINYKTGRPVSSYEMMNLQNLPIRERLDGAAHDEPLYTVTKKAFETADEEDDWSGKTI